MPPTRNRTAQDAANSSACISADLVLSVLSGNAQKCFRILLRAQLATPSSVGLTLREWFELCRSSFAASSEAALNGHIKEFVDHQLVKKRRGAGGVECFYCTLPKEKMAQLVPSDAAA